MIMSKIVEIYGWGHYKPSGDLWRTYLPDVPVKDRRSIDVCRITSQGMKITRITLKFEGVPSE